MKTIEQIAVQQNNELYLQTYLRSYTYNGVSIDITLNSLYETYKIKTKQSTIYPNLYLFKYSQIESPMNERIVQECRGIILDSADNWNVVSYPFNKFFNLGENQYIQSHFDWDDYKVYPKEDGSLVQLYYYANKWNIASSGNPDASGNVNDYNITFNELVQRYLPSQEILSQVLDSSLTYIFELVTLENKNVVRYSPTEYNLYLLGARGKYTFEEYSPEYVISTHPPVFTNLTINICRSISNKEIYKKVDELKGEDAEGYILVDKDFNRLKVKSKDYVAKHHLRSSWSLKNAIQVVLNNEIDEVTNYFPEYAGQLTEIKNKIEHLVDTIYSTYSFCSKLSTVKDVGLYLKHDNLPFKHIIFTLYKQGVIPSEDAVKNEVYKIEAYKFVEVCQ